jgi:hypothetical protein
MLEEIRLEAEPADLSLRQKHIQALDAFRTSPVLYLGTSPSEGKAYKAQAPREQK